MRRSLRTALVDLYHQSWRLLPINVVVAVPVLAIAAGAVYAPAVLVLLVLVGPPLAALVHCAVTLAQTDELRIADALRGLRLHWLRGLVLAALVWAAFALGVLALDFYAEGAWTLPLAALVVYVLAGVALLQLWAWPLLVYEPERSLRGVLADAARGLLRRPTATAALGLVLLVVNAAGAAAALMPLVTLTLAYSFLAAAHFALPRNPLREVPDG